MKYFVEIKTHDGLTKTYECNDFPIWGADFVTLYKKDFVREKIRVSAIEYAKEYWHGGRKD